MEFAFVCIIALIALGVVAAIASLFQKGDETVVEANDCASCSAVADGSCKIGCLMERQRVGDGKTRMEKKRQKDNKVKN